MNYCKSNNSLRYSRNLNEAVTGGPNHGGDSLFDIILVDDDPDHRVILKNRLGKIFCQCSVKEFSDADTALGFLDMQKHVPDMVVSDLCLENTKDGLDLFRELQRRKIPSQFILVSSNRDELANRRGELRNGDLCLLKDQLIKGNVDILREKIRRKRAF